MEATEINKERIEEIQVDVTTDEFQNYFSMEYEPKVLITFRDNPFQVLDFDNCYNNLFVFFTFSFKISICNNQQIMLFIFWVADFDI